MLCFEHQGFAGLQLPFMVLDSVFLFYLPIAFGTQM